MTANETLIATVGSITTAASTGWLGAEILRIVYRPVASNAQTWQHDERRRAKLRAGSRIYRWFEPLVDEASKATWLLQCSNLPSLERSLKQGASALPWTAAEYCAARFIELLLTSVVIWVALFQSVEESTASILALGYSTYQFFRTANLLAKAAERRMARFKQRLPFAIDLLALMMEAGGDFRQCLGIVVQENKDHPVGEEFARLQQAYAAGQPLRESLDEMQARLRDEDVSEMVFSVKNAEELGVPLSKTFLVLAEQMRMKQAQYAEKIIGQRKTMLTFPGLIVMVACLLTAVAPFILGAVYKS